MSTKRREGGEKDHDCIMRGIGRTELEGEDRRKVARERGQWRRGKTGWRKCVATLTLELGKHEGKREREIISFGIIPEALITGLTPFLCNINLCRWACGHTLRDHVRNENIKERLEVESIAERCRNAGLRWFGHVEARPRLRRKKDSGDGTTREKKARKNMPVNWILKINIVQLDKKVIVIMKHNTEQTILGDQQIISKEHG